MSLVMEVRIASNSASAGVQRVRAATATAHAKGPGACTASESLRQKSPKAVFNRSNTTKLSLGCSSTPRRLTVDEYTVSHILPTQAKARVHVESETLLLTRPAGLLVRNLSRGCRPEQAQKDVVNECDYVRERAGIVAYKCKFAMTGDAERAAETM